jgi:hypothetical protein
MVKMGRAEALRELITGRRLQQITVKRGLVSRKEEKGQQTTSMVWSDRQPHPANMSKYNDLNRDSEVETAITTLTGMIAGVGFYTEMGKEENPDNPNKKAIDAYAEKINLDEKASTIVRVRFEKGFCPVERLADGDLKLLPPETFYVWKKPTGEVYKYTQEITEGNPIASWDKDELKNVILFVRKETPSNPYGQAIVEPIAERIEQRREMAEDVPDVIHKYGYPFRVWEADTDAIMDEAFNQATAREIDEDIFLGNVPKDALRIHSETLDPRINFTEYVTHNDEQIAEGLFAPLLLYLRNATEASAKTILEAIDRYVQGEQRYIKRRFEKYLFEPLVGKPTPRLIWGSPRTGLEDVDLDGVAKLYEVGALLFPQVQDLIKKLGLPIIDQPKQQPTPNITGPPIVQVPQELRTSLSVIEGSFRAHQLTAEEALKHAGAAVSTHIARLRAGYIRILEAGGVPIKGKLSPESEDHFKLMRNELMNEFYQRIIPTGAKLADESIGRKFTVIVDG